MKTKKPSQLRDLKMPKVVKLPPKESKLTGDYANFPLAFYRYSSLTRFSSNPFMFKVNYLNNDTIETTSSAASVLGSALHKAMQAYMGGADDVSTPTDEAGAIKAGHDYGLEYLKNYSEGMVEWSATIPSMAKMMERYAFAYFEYIKALNLPARCPEVLFVEHRITDKVDVDGKTLPIPLSGTLDLVYRDKEKRVRLHDHKFTSRFSDLDEIDGAKLIQAAFYYFLGYAETGERPYSITFAECKITENREKDKPQVQEFEIVYEDHPLIFEFFFRLYQDVTDALLGKMVYVPNVYAMFDREVSILAYIHRLDVQEDRAEQFKKMKVDNITDFLKKKIQKSGTEKKYLETVTKKFISATTLNYSTMNTQEKIKMKLAEHGIGVEFDSKLTGGSVELYRFEPSVGVKMTRVEAFAKDIEQVVGVSGIRVLAPIPDSELIGFEIPLKTRTFPKDVPEAEGFNLAIGQNIQGETVRMDIRTAPHILVAGATGSGKSVFIGNLVRQLKTLPDAKLTLLDPKKVELQQYADTSTDYADSPREIATLLKALVKEMNQRYEILKSHKVRNLDQFRDAGGKLPYLVAFIDEYGDLTTDNKYGEIISGLLLTLGQKARAAGIHIVLTTQRPSTKIISGDIKANFPTRIAFKTATMVDSQVIIDHGGAEKLLGKGDMLFRHPERNGETRLQGFGA